MIPDILIYLSPYLKFNPLKSLTHLHMKHGIILVSAPTLIYQPDLLDILQNIAPIQILLIAATQHSSV